MTSEREVVPGASRLMHSLRDIGYDLETSVADLIDNSIDARARSVAIDFHNDGANSWIRIADDGAGMTPSALDEAMRFGSSREYGSKDLGRFGLGLKTASLSQCRRLTVASRTTAKGRITVRRWDLDRVAETNSWALQSPASSELPDSLLAPLRERPGTVVMWEGLDRLESFRDPDGRRAASAISADAKRVAAHLGVVFHRFLVGRGERRLKVTVDGDRVQPWDPFCRNEQETQCLRVQRIRDPSGRLIAAVSPYILPSQAAFSTREAHEQAAGPKKWNRQQGLYIYRQDRLVQGGGWSRLRTMDEHSKLARIAVDIPSGTEESWKLNISKMSASVPRGLRAPLRTILSGVVTRAQETYRTSLRDEPALLLADTVEPGWSLGDHWEEIAKVVGAELSEYPAVRDRLLERLINSRAVNHGGDAEAA